MRPVATGSARNGSPTASARSLGRVLSTGGSSALCSNRNPFDLVECDRVTVAAILYGVTRAVGLADLSTFPNEHSAFPGRAEELIGKTVSIGSRQPLGEWAPSVHCMVLGNIFGSSGRTRTYNPSVNSRTLYH